MEADPEFLLHANFASYTSRPSASSEMRLIRVATSEYTLVSLSTLTHLHASPKTLYTFPSQWRCIQRSIKW